MKFEIDHFLIFIFIKLFQCSRYSKHKCYITIYFEFKKGPEQI
jgi:hypothetical protein